MNHPTRLAVLCAVVALSFVGLASTAYAATFDVTSTSDAGAGTLRAAIDDANAASGSNVIDFDLPGSGTHTINLLSGLPALTGTVSIVGSTVGSPNVISGNRGSGVEVQGSSFVGIQANLIGTDPSGETAVANANQGIEIDNASADTTVGGTASGTGNLISGNAMSGVEIDASSDTALTSRSWIWLTA